MNVSPKAPFRVLEDYGLAGFPYNPLHKMAIQNPGLWHGFLILLPGQVKLCHFQKTHCVYPGLRDKR